MTPARAPPEAMMAGAALVVDWVAAEPVLVLPPLLVGLPDPEPDALEPDEPVGAAAVSDPVPEGELSLPPEAPVGSGVPSEVTK